MIQLYLDSLFCLSSGVSKHLLTNKAVMSKTIDSKQLVDVLALRDFEEEIKMTMLLLYYYTYIISYICMYM